VWRLQIIDSSVVELALVKELHSNDTNYGLHVGISMTLVWFSCHNFVLFKPRNGCMIFKFTVN
jgi:hypothetical protein